MTVLQSAPNLAGLSIGVHRATHDCKPQSKAKPLGVTVTSAGIVWQCFRCGESGASRTGSTPHRHAHIESTFTTLSDWGRDLWSSCRPVEGIGKAYLDARGCVIPPTDGDLRYHAALKHPSGYEGPALVGLVTDSRTATPISLHRTWIRPDGTKAPMDPPRLLLKGHRKAGGCIRLWPDEAVTTGLAVAEGIETALAAAHAHQPIWAAIDAGNMAQFPVLAGIDAITIFTDNDDAGRSAASECGRRWARAHREACLVTPNAAKADINDLVRPA